jgi:hypothetical protein
MTVIKRLMGVPVRFGGEEHPGSQLSPTVPPVRNDLLNTARRTLIEEWPLMEQGNLP